MAIVMKKTGRAPESRSTPYPRRAVPSAASTTRVVAMLPPDLRGLSDRLPERRLEVILELRGGGVRPRLADLVLVPRPRSAIRWYGFGASLAFRSPARFCLLGFVVSSLHHRPGNEHQIGLARGLSWHRRGSASGWVAQKARAA